MRYAVLFALFFASAAVFGANADEAKPGGGTAPKAGTVPKKGTAPKADAAPKEDLTPVHDWHEEKGEGYILFISNHPAPKPYSDTGEPEATMKMEGEPAPKNITLQKIMESEVAGIRQDLMIGDYPESEAGHDSHKPDHGIVAYIEKIDGRPVAFIKYRVIGANGKELPHPRIVVHAILLKDERVYFVHLIVLYPGHIDEVTGDQLRAVKAIIRN